MNYFKQLLALGLALVLTLILAIAPLAAVEETGFSDVPAGAWYQDAVFYCVTGGLMGGTSETTFSPDATMTRAMLATVLYRLAGSPAVSEDGSFTDTAEGLWYSDAVRWAAQQNLVTGYGDGRFGPEDPVTREQLAAILWRRAGSPALSDSSAPFADQNAISPYAVEAVAWARVEGIINGRDGNRFVPAGEATRAEVASILKRVTEEVETPPEPPAPDRPDEGNHILIAYFSATGQTGQIAAHLGRLLPADLYEITPEIPYTADDLNYNTDCRANREQRDPDARPAISGSVSNMAQYDVIFLGYPIWHGQAPKIISTFLETYDLSGKTIIPFCTSGSSPIGSSAANLHPLAPEADWLPGNRFSGGASESTVADWVSGLPLPQPPAAETPPVDENPAGELLTLTVGGRILTATLADNASARALRELLAEGARTLELHDYNQMEKVGPLGSSLPTNDERITAEPGDLILYQGNQFVLYYAPNTWSLTRLGRLNDITADELRALLGSGDVTVTLSFAAS